VAPFERWKTGVERPVGFLTVAGRLRGMTAMTEDPWLRRSVIITFLWLLTMLVAGYLLIQFSGAFQGTFT
jgi:hypothetical protein